MSTPESDFAARIARRAAPGLAFVELKGKDGGESLLVPGVVATRHCVAISSRFIAGRPVADTAFAAIRQGERRWPAVLTGLRAGWDTCCYSPERDELPIEPATTRWSHTLDEGEEIFAVEPLPGGSATAIGGWIVALQRAEESEPWERARVGAAFFADPVAPGQPLFDTEGRLVGMISVTVENDVPLGAFLPAERLSGLPAVAMVGALAAQGLDEDLLKSAGPVDAQRDPRILGAVAAAARRLSRLPLALEALDALLALDPEHPWAHFERASVLAEQGRADDSVAALERAACFDPERYGWEDDPVRH